MLITRTAILVALVTGLMLWLVLLLAPVLTPFVAGALLAYVGNPLVTRLTRHMPRSAATALVFLTLLLLAVVVLIIAVPQLLEQLSALLQALPRFVDWLEQQALPWLAQRLGVPQEMLSLKGLRGVLAGHMDNAGQLAAQGLARIASSGLSAFGALMTLVIVPVVTFYLLRDWPQLVAAVRELLPRRIEPTAVRLAQEADRVLGGFLHGQLLVMLVLSSVYVIGLGLVGLQQAFVIGVVAGLVTFVPYLGLVVGLGLAGSVAVIQFHDLAHLLAVAGVFGVAQLLESFVLTPLLVGDRIGLHPVAVIFVVLAGGELFGFFGVLLALPVGAVLLVLLREARARYDASRLYQAPEAEALAASSASDPGPETQG